MTHIIPVITNIRELISDLSDVDLSILEERNINLTDLSSENIQVIACAANDEIVQSYEWTVFAGRLELLNLRRIVKPTFSEAMMTLSKNLDKKYLNFIVDNAEIINSIVNHSLDDKFDYFGIMTLKSSYCKRDDDGNIQEVPSYMYMRIASFIHFPNIDRIRNMYLNLANRNYSQATPTIVNSGNIKAGLSSCVTMSIFDNIDDITDKWKTIAILSKNCAGIGADFSNLRHSKISDGSVSQGLVPWLQITNYIIKGVPQRERKGSLCAYLEVWHTDIFEFLQAKEPTGNPDMKARYLFYGLMVCDLFMKRVESNGIWSLFCPNIAKRLDSTYGDTFEKLYECYEERILFTHQVPARKLWDEIIRTQITTGGPFILYKDAINRKCNQTHDGQIVRLSNLCTEITGVTNEHEIFSCNLAGVALNNCVIGEGEYDYKKLAEITKECVRNLDCVIDKSYYPINVPELRRANFTRRPIGIGVQGLADAAVMMGYSWVDAVKDDEGNVVYRNHESIISNDINDINNDPTNKNYIKVPVLKLDKQFQEWHFKMFEVMYFAGIEESIQLAKEEGKYPTFDGSPASKGLFQIDLWMMERFKLNNTSVYLTDPWKYYELAGLKLSTPKTTIEKLRREMMTYGLRHSLLFALMPTATTAHIIGNNESFEPFNSLVGKRRVLSGEYKIVNKYFIKEATKLGIWCTKLYQHIAENDNILQYPKPDNISSDDYLKLQLKYMTIFEFPQKLLLDLSRDRGYFICQSQSMNCHMMNLNSNKLHAYHFYGWKLGLKTGMYYCRNMENVKAINFAISGVKIKEKKNDNVQNDSSVCTNCSI